LLLQQNMAEDAASGLMTQSKMAVLDEKMISVGWHIQIEPGVGGFIPSSISLSSPSPNAFACNTRTSCRLTSTRAYPCASSAAHCGSRFHLFVSTVTPSGTVTVSLQTVIQSSVSGNIENK
jgi:DNA-binding beta-propeller fold protein YncE